MMMNSACFAGTRAFNTLACACGLDANLRRRSGVYHWAMDNYGGKDTPVFGEQIEAFQVRRNNGEIRAPLLLSLSLPLSLSLSLSLSLWQWAPAH